MHACINHLKEHAGLPQANNSLSIGYQWHPEHLLNLTMHIAQAVVGLHAGGGWQLSGILLPQCMASWLAFSSSFLGRPQSVRETWRAGKEVGTFVASLVRQPA